MRHQIEHSGEVKFTVNVTVHHVADSEVLRRLDQLGERMSDLDDAIDTLGTRLSNAITEEANEIKALIQQGNTAEAIQRLNAMGDTVENQIRGISDTAQQP